jgi:sulfate transport system substrate-binding protein
MSKLSLLALVALFVACRSPGGDEAAPSGPRARTLTIGGYTTPREVYGKAILPAFAKHWKAKTGETVEFSESWQGSGAQARAIIGGFEADVAALSLEADVRKIVDAGLITHDWKTGPFKGIVSTSVVVLGVRQGNPKGVLDWADLARPGLEVVTPDVKTSGGAMWNILAIYGAAKRGNLDPEPRLAAILGNVRVMDKGARESMITFEKGVGDVAITYENEILTGKAAGQTYEYVVPSSTILIENPAAVVDRYAKKHGNEDLAREFVAFLATDEVQKAFAAHGYRPVNAAAGGAFPAVADLFTVRDLGDWKGVGEAVFAKGAAYDRAIAARK